MKRIEKDDYYLIEDNMDWFNVNSSLPEPYVPVLCRMPGEKPHPTVREGFVSRDGIWYSAMFIREPGEVTHWADMPVYPDDDDDKHQKK